MSDQTPISRDRYIKHIHDTDREKAGKNYRRAALLGGISGALLRKKLGIKKAALIGAGAGVGAQAIARAATAQTKDQFGERSHAGKAADKLVPTAGLVTAAVLGHRALKRHKFSAKTKAKKALAKLKDIYHSKHGPFATAAGLTGGIAIADGVTGAVFPEHGETRKEAIKKGLKKGLLYGGALAASEPLVAKLFARGDVVAKAHEFGFIAGLAGTMAASPLIEGSRRKLYRAVRRKFKSPKLARAASYAPEAVIGSAAYAAGSAIGDRIKKPKPQELMARMRLIAFGEAKKKSKAKRALRAAAITAGAGAGALIGARTLPRLIRRGKPLAHGESTAGKIIYTHEGLTTPGSVIRLPGGTSVRRHLDKAARKGSKLAGAATKVDDFLGLPQRHYGIGVGQGRVVEKTKAHASRVVSDDKFARGNTIHVDSDVSPKNAGDMEAMDKRYQEAVGRGKNGKLCLIGDNCEHHAREIGGQGRVSHQSQAIIGGLAGGAALGGVAAAAATRNKKQQLMANLRNLIHFDRNRDRLERTRDRISIAKDAAIGGLGVAGIAGLGVLTHHGIKAARSLTKAGGEAVNSAKNAVVQHAADLKGKVEPILRDVKHATGNMKNVAEAYGDAGRLYKGSKEGAASILHPKKLIHKIRKQFREGMRDGEAIRRQADWREKMGVNPARAREVARRRVLKQQRMSAIHRLREFAHYPGYHEDYDQGDRPLTAEQHAEIAHDRRSLRNHAIAVGALAIGAGYVAKDNPGMKLIRRKAGDWIAKKFPGAHKNKLVKGAFPKSSADLVPHVPAPASDIPHAQPELANLKPHPDVTGQVKPKAPSKRKRKGKDKIIEAAARLREVLFSSEEQLKNRDHQYASPLRGILGQDELYAPKVDRDGNIVRNKKGAVVRSSEAMTHDELVGHAQTWRSIHRSAKKTLPKIKHAGGIVSDVADVVRGKPRIKDPWGRKRKREWEKPWFKNALGAGALTIGGLAIAKRRPDWAHKAGKFVHDIQDHANSIVPDLVPRAIRKMSAIVSRIDDHLHEFDETAAEWDIRHGNGSSARVYAPGSRARQRREKYWHEKLDNERKLWGAGIVGSALAGAAISKRIRAAKGIVRAVEEAPQAVRTARKAARPKFIGRNTQPRQKAPPYSPTPDNIVTADFKKKA